MKQELKERLKEKEEGGTKGSLPPFVFRDLGQLLVPNWVLASHDCTFNLVPGEFCLTARLIKFRKPHVNTEDYLLKSFLLRKKSFSERELFMLFAVF